RPRSRGGEGGRTTAPRDGGRAAARRLPQRATPPCTAATRDRPVEEDGPLPDTLRGTMHAEDPDGIDSVWLAVGAGPPLALNGLLETAFDAPFVFLVARGYPPGDRLPVKLSARDVAGFRGELDTIVTVTP